jgi:hypothetical protein
MFIPKCVHVRPHLVKYISFVFKGYLLPELPLRMKRVFSVAMFGAQLCQHSTTLYNPHLVIVIQRNIAQGISQRRIAHHCPCKMLQDCFPRSKRSFPTCTLTSTRTRLPQLS